MRLRNEVEPVEGDFLVIGVPSNGEATFQVTKCWSLLVVGPNGQLKIDQCFGSKHEELHADRVIVSATD